VAAAVQVPLTLLTAGRVHQHITQQPRIDPQQQQQEEQYRLHHQQCQQLQQGQQQQQQQQAVMSVLRVDTAVGLPERGHRLSRAVLLLAKRPPLLLLEMLVGRMLLELWVRCMGALGPMASSSRAQGWRGLQKRRDSSQTVLQGMQEHASVPRMQLCAHSLMPSTQRTGVQRCRFQQQVQTLWMVRSGSQPVQQGVGWGQCRLQMTQAPLSIRNTWSVTQKQWHHHRQCPSSHRLFLQGLRSTKKQASLVQGD